MEDKKKRGTPQDVTSQSQQNEKVSRREAMKRIAKGIALVGTLGVTAVITQGQDECAGGYSNFYNDFYYNYSNAYYNYSNAYYNYSNAYYNYVEFYYNYYDYYNYYNYYNYSDYQNYYDYYNH